MRYNLNHFPIFFNNNNRFDYINGPRKYRKSKKSALLNALKDFEMHKAFKVFTIHFLNEKLQVQNFCFSVFMS